jgi:signal transduction histidine kinase
MVGYDYLDVHLMPGPSLLRTSDLQISAIHKARLAFTSALVLLILSAVASSIAIDRFSDNSKWVVHSYEVQNALGDVRSTETVAARARLGYVLSGKESFLEEYAASSSPISDALHHVRELVADNSAQMLLCAKLEDLTQKRVQLLQSSIDLRKAGHAEELVQDRFSRENIVISTELSDVMQQMNDEEQRLLARRKASMDRLFKLVLAILTAAFALSALLFWIHYKMLSGELRGRQQMEEFARHLSGRLLQLQDEERRKFARELHDGLGQLLAMAKMHLSISREEHPGDVALTETEVLLNQSIKETRTISHLLHPPLLDEMGLASAAAWYLEEFGQRSGLQVSVDIGEDVSRLSHPAELALFRILQEAFTNIHRHSKSSKAEVSLRRVDNTVVLRVHDNGQGIPADTLHRFQSDGTHVGVGLGGMRERVREQGGKLDIKSDGAGTTISVAVPLSEVKISV